MNAPAIWILAPLLAAIFLWMIQNLERWVYVLGLLCTAVLAWAAWQFPIGETVEFGPWAFTIDATLNVLGRTFTLDNGDRPFLIMVFLTAGLWFAWSRFAQTHRYFLPLGLSLVSLFVAALAVEPFLYAALLIEMAVLISVPMLAPPGRPPGQAILRYVIFQTLAMPFILFTGWMLTGVESSPAEVGLVVRAGVMLGLGFAFLLAVFPFYTWIPLLTEQTHPYAAGFVLTSLQTIILLFGLTFLEKFAWLRTSTALFDILRTTGVLMILTGGVWAAFQQHLGRLLGYAIIVETGFALLAISTAPDGGIGSFAMLFLPRLIAIGTWAFSISLLMKSAGSLNLSTLQGAGRKLRFISMSLILAQFSLAGLPLLASFPVKQAILTRVANHSLLLALGVFLGSVGLMISAFRTLEVFVGVPTEDVYQRGETRGEKAVLLLGIAFLVLIGIVPQAFLTPMTDLLSAFIHLSW